MGSPRKQRRKYSTPFHPWQRERIDEENQLEIDYGLKNKTEIWIARSLLTNFFSQAKRLTAVKTEQTEKEKVQLINRLKSLGLVGETATLNDVLELTLIKILDRRLQSVVFKKGLARSMKQARQLITHRHISVAGRNTTSPGHIVLKEEEPTINYTLNSSFIDEIHPERMKPGEAPKKQKKIQPAEKGAHGHGRQDRKSQGRRPNNRSEGRGRRDRQ